MKKSVVNISLPDLERMVAVREGPTTRRRGMVGRFFPLFAFLCLELAHNALAARKIVVPGDFPTIQKAINGAEEGDTVFVSNGIYKEKIQLKERIALIGQSPEKTIIKGDRSGPVVRGVNHSRIQSLTIENGQTGILCENTNTSIENNIIRKNKTGIHCLISLPEIRNNIVFRNRWTGIFCELITYAPNTSIQHNIIAENGYCGLMLARKSGVLIQNNIFLKNKQYGIFVDIESRRSRIVYNDFFVNRKPYNSYAVVDKTNLYVDPLIEIRGDGAYSFALANNSPLKNAGKNGKNIGPESPRTGEEQKTDSDHDKISDIDDKCPDLKEDLDEFEDWDGCPDYDNDLDGLYDDQDSCPHKPEDNDGFKDDDGCPDVDNDRDGICDPWVQEKGLSATYRQVCTGSDDCPMKPETVNGFKDNDGCPDQKEE